MLKLNDEVLYFNAKHPVDREKPRKAWVTGVNPDGTYDVTYLLLAVDALDINTGAFGRAERCRFFDEKTVRGNRRGDPDKWDWTVTGERFVCREVPQVIAQPKLTRKPSDREFDDGSKPAAEPVAVGAPSEPVPDSESEPVRARPPVPTPSTNTTRRIQPRPGVKLE